ncbi:hypothetical protein [Glycomyces sp. NPDC048151]|uniref:hypothetical protein n=1 Tax=Glycomyces sp. NPDC048151 TaxID=3364002 RepID=UPI003716EB27
MVSVSLRQNGGGVPERNSYGRENVQAPITFTPGRTSEDWVETRTREAGHDRWPHPENPGLIPDAGGYFDWAGRLLFLPDGSPNPEVAGAYRYQTRPDLCDPHAPDSEPVSPRYEPMWLRHRPGDTWMIGGKPFDPDDPGPYGNPRWRPDRRTGRHRRGERPDPIAPWDWHDGDPEPPDFAATGVRWDAHGDWTPDRIAASGNPRDGAGAIPERPAYRPERPAAERRARPPAFDLEDSVPDLSFRSPDPGWISGSCATPAAPGAAAPPRNRGDDDSAEQDSPPRTPREVVWRPAPPASRRPRFWSDDPPEPDSGPEPFRFTGLRERAWSEFLTDSQPLYDDHLKPTAPDLRDRVSWFLRCLLWVLTIGVVASPRPLEPARAPSRPAPGQPTRVTARCAVPSPTIAPVLTRTPPEAIRFEPPAPRLPRLSLHSSGTAVA